MRITGREPAAVVGLIEAAIALAVAFGLGWSPEQVALTMAAVTAAGGVYVAWATRDTLLGAVVGLTKAVLALAIGFGLHIGPEQTAAIVAFVTVLGGFFNRTQTSPVVAGTVVDVFDEPYRKG